MHVEAERLQAIYWRGHECSMCLMQWMCSYIDWHACIHVWLRGQAYKHAPLDSSLRPLALEAADPPPDAAAAAAEAVLPAAEAAAAAAASHVKMHGRIQHTLTAGQPLERDVTLRKLPFAMLASVRLFVTTPFDYPSVLL